MITDVEFGLINWSQCQLFSKAAIIGQTALGSLATSFGTLAESDYSHFEGLVFAKIGHSPDAENPANAGLLVVD